MVMEENVKDKVINIVSKITNVDVSKINKDTDLTKDLEADSLAIVELIMALEEEYGIEISDEEAPKIKTVNDMIEDITKKLDDKNKKA